MSRDRLCQACAVSFQATTREKGGRGTPEVSCRRPRPSVYHDHTRTTRDGQCPKPRCGDLTSDLWPEALTLATHRNPLSPAREGRLGSPRSLSILHALIGPRTTFQRHGPRRKDRSDLEGGSEEQGAQNTNKLLRVKFRDAYPRWDWLVSC